MYQSTVFTLLIFVVFTFNSCGGNIQSKNHNYDKNKNVLNILRSQNKAGFYAIEVDIKNGIPIVGGDIFNLDVSKFYYNFTYTNSILKIEYSTSQNKITLLGIVNGKTGKVPHTAKIIKVYFIKNNNVSFKVFEVFPLT